VRNRHHAGCHVAAERAAGRYTLICAEPVSPTSNTTASIMPMAY
jgi:hypothetical protein